MWITDTEKLIQVLFLYNIGMYIALIKYKCLLITNK